MSLQARALNALLRIAVKRRLKRVRRIDTALVHSVRADVESTTRWLPPLTPDLSVTALDAGGVPGWRVAAAGTDTTRALLYLHGGAYVCGSAAVYRDVATRLSAACGAPVLAVDYRLAPEHRFPAALDDARRAFAWLRERHGAERLALAGDSAGGGLVLAALLAERDAGHALPACAVTFSAWTDLAGSGDSLRENASRDPWLVPSLLPDTAALYLGATPATEPLASPLYGEPAGLPPLLMHVVDGEILRDDTLRFAERATRAGVEVHTRTWHALPHAFPVFARLLPEARRCLADSGAWVRHRWQRGAGG